MNDKNTGRRFCEQLCTGNTDILSGVATRKRYAAGLIAGLLLAGAAHATDIVIPAGVKNGDVVYTYAGIPTTAKAYPPTNVNLNSRWMCASPRANYSYNYTHSLGVYGLGVRQVSGSTTATLDAQTNVTEFNSIGFGLPNPGTTLDTPSRDTGYLSLSSGSVQVYVIDARKLPTTSITLTKLAYEIASFDLVGGAPCAAYSGPTGYLGLTKTGAESGGFRWPTPDGNVTLVVNNPAARTKVHNACQTGGHAGTCQRIHNFAVTHHKR